VVKLNSADFQHGGITEEEAVGTVQALEAAGADAIEISGGNYESPQMVATGESLPVRRESTLRREAFFLEFARMARAVSQVPLLLTGGLRRAETMADVIASGAVDLVGLARPLAMDPDFPARLLRGEIDAAPVALRPTGLRAVDSLLQSLWHQDQMRRMAAGLPPDPRLSRTVSLIKGMYATLGPG
jgi:2,4-dienoyl-CoA reductase-like NADH-dependent reductase (Old Yellow Enzyme family)